MHVEATLILPPGWNFAPRTLDFTVPAASAGTANFRISIPGDWDRNQPRVALAADLIVDGQYIGQVAEGVVDLQFSAVTASPTSSLRSAAERQSKDRLAGPFTVDFH
jgi:hypothetical protein